jgi:peptidoglycan hydrolase-like protein with peptidoglycan-binding domain
LHLNQKLRGIALADFHNWASIFNTRVLKKEAVMKNSRLAILSSLAFGAAVIVNAPYAWSQASPGETGGQKSGGENRVQKPTDPPMSGGQSTPGQAGVSRSEGTGMQSGTERRTTGGQWSKDKVKAIQEALKTKGFDPGTADGVVGPKTNQALRDFQKSNNLQATGRIDDKTASALGVEAGSMGSSSSSSMGKESTSGSRGTSGRSSSSSEEKTGSDPATGGARGGTTTNPPSKPTGRE